MTNGKMLDFINNQLRRIKHGRYPWLRDGVPHSLLALLLMGHAGHKAQRTDSGTGGIGRRLKLDLLAHARHLCRPALGTHGRGQWKLGLFADPYRYCNEKRAKKEIFTPAHRAEARNIAAETFVLLKNNGKILPLQKKGRIALVGPLGNSKRNMSGTWSLVARFDENKTLLQAMKEAVGDKAEVLYARGSNFMHDTKLEANAGISERDKRSDKEILDEAIAVSRNADVIVAAVGESSEMSGECCSCMFATLLAACHAQ